MKKLILALLLFTGATQLNATVHFTAIRTSATTFGVYMIPDATFTTAGTSVVSSYTVTIRVPAATYPTAPNFTVAGNTAYVTDQPDAILKVQNTTGTAYQNIQFAWTTTHNAFNITFTQGQPYRMAQITLPAGVNMDDIEVVDWARNRLDNSTSNGLNWSAFLAIDGTDLTNNAAIFASSASTPAGGLTNSGSTTGTSTLKLSSSLGPLPIKLTTFDAKKATGNRVQLNWQTAQETGTDYFEVERSLDGKSFNTSIRRMTAAGNSTTPLDYQTYDNAPAQGVNYYRLKMVDVSGKYAYSEVRTVNFDGAVRSYTLTPNPAKEFVMVKGMDAGASILIMSTTGQVISTTKATGTAETINLNMVPGTYYVQIVQDGSIVYNTKFTKQ